MIKTTQIRNPFSSHFSLKALVTGIALVQMGTVSAFEISNQTEGLTLRFDNSIRYNLGTRIDDQNDKISAGTKGFLYDDSDYKFDQSDIVNNRLDLLTEFEADWKSLFGARISTSAWADDAYGDVSVNKNPSLKMLSSSYNNDTYSKTTKRYYRGPSGEILDAFVYGNFSVSDSPINVKAGQLVQYWGTALFSAGGIAYSQHPIDGRKAMSSPGTEVRETFLPLNQISVQSQINDWFSLAAQYYLDWDYIRIPEGGTFLGSADFLLDGPNQFGASYPVSITDPITPKDKSGNWGITAKSMLANFNASTLAFYYRKFDEKNSFWLLMDPSSLGKIHAVFPEDTKLIGLSLDTTVGSYALSLELAMRKNTALQTVGMASSEEGARGDVFHAVFDTIYSWNSPLWDTASVVAEVSVDHLVNITKNESLFLSQGSSNCPLGKFDSCATRNAAGIGLRFTPSYLQVFPGVDLNVPVFITGGLKGNTADFGGTNEQAYSYSVGAEFDIRKQHQVSLTWADAHAKIISDGAGGYTGNGPWQTTDRGRINLTAKTSF